MKKQKQIRNSFLKNRNDGIRLKKRKKRKEKDNSRCEVAIFFKDLSKKRGGFSINMTIRGN